LDRLSYNPDEPIIKDLILLKQSLDKKSTICFNEDTRHKKYYTFSSFTTEEGVHGKLMPLSKTSGKKVKEKMYYSIVDRSYNFQLNKD